MKWLWVQNSDAELLEPTKSVVLVHLIKVMQCALVRRLSARGMVFATKEFVVAAPSTTVTTVPYFAAFRPVLQRGCAKMVLANALWGGEVLHAMRLTASLLVPLMGHAAAAFASVILVIGAVGASCGCVPEIALVHLTESVTKTPAPVSVRETGVVWIARSLFGLVNPLARIGESVTTVHAFVLRDGKALIAVKSFLVRIHVKVVLFGMNSRWQIFARARM